VGAENVLSSLRRLVSRLKYVVKVIQGLGGVYPRTCPGCGYVGKFRAFGIPPRFDAECPRCHSLERHRLFMLATQNKSYLFRGEADLLHIAPEPLLQKILQPRCKTYTTLDLSRTDVDVRESIEGTTLPQASYDHIVCSHVLEHVDDGKALREMFRILRSGGTLFAMVPITEGWDFSYEDNAIVSPTQREVHFGQNDHVRYYGRDFRDRLVQAGFAVTEVTAEGADVVKFGLLRGEKLFVGQKA